MSENKCPSCGDPGPPVAHCENCGHDREGGVVNNSIKEILFWPLLICVVLLTMSLVKTIHNCERAIRVITQQEQLIQKQDVIIGKDVQALVKAIQKTHEENRQ